MGKGADAALDAVFVYVDQKLHAGSFGNVIAKLDHLAEFPGGIDME